MRTLLYLMLFIAFPAPAQTPSETRELIFDVVDEKTAQPIDGISPASLQVKLDRQPLPVLSLQRTHLHPKVALLMDVSGSMDPNTYGALKWNAAWNFIFEVVARLTPEAEFSLYTFNETVTFEASSVAGTPTVLNRINELRRAGDMAKKRTSTRDAIAYVIRTQHLNSHDSVLVITDGGDNHSRISESDIKRLIAAAGVRIFACALLEDYPTTPEEKMGPIALENFTRATGGVSDELHTSEQQHKPKLLQGMAASIAASILNPYVAQLDLAPSLQGALKLELSDESGSKLKGVAIYKPARIAALDSLTSPATGR